MWKKYDSLKPAPDTGLVFPLFVTEAFGQEFSSVTTNKLFMAMANALSIIKGLVVPGKKGTPATIGIMPGYIGYLL